MEIPVLLKEWGFICWSQVAIAGLELIVAVIIIAIVIRGVFEFRKFTKGY